MAGNDLWELGKMALVGLLSALGGGGLVRAFGQNRNEATAHLLALVGDLDESNKDLARRIDAQAAQAVVQAQSSGENRARIAYMESEAMLQAARIEGLADQVMLERRVREMETRTLTTERDLLLQRVVILEREAKACHEMLENQEKMLQELRSIRAGQVVAATVHADVAERTAQLVAGQARTVASDLAARVPPSVDANTTAVEAQTLATTENTEAVRRDTEARSDDT